MFTRTGLITRQLAIRAIAAIGMKREVYNGWTWGSVAELDRVLADLCLSCLDGNPADAPIEFERIPSSPLARVYRFSHEGEAYFLKENLCSGVARKLKERFRTPRSIHGAVGNIVLQKSGIHSPQTILVAFGKGRDFVLTQEIPDVQSLYCLEQEKPLYAGLSLPALATIVGREVGRMHAANIRHADLRYGNILLSGQGPDLKVYFVDNERTARVPNMYLRFGRLKNLAQLGFSARLISPYVKLRFLSAYIKHGAMSREDAVSLWTSAKVRVTKRLARRGLQGRMD